MSAASLGPVNSRRLTRRGQALEWTTLGWNVIGVAVLAYLAYTASSVGLLGFGLDSLIEIGASLVVVWELSNSDDAHQAMALLLIGVAFVGLGIYLLAVSVVTLITQHHAIGSPGGIVWTGLTAVVMFALAAGKRATGRALDNPVLIAEARVTFIDGLLAVAVLLSVASNTLFGWWWADPLASFTIVFYAFREAFKIFNPMTAVS